MLMVIIGLSAQIQDWQWEKQVNATCNKIETDNSGNSYVIGSFSGSVSFDATTLNSANGSRFVGKLDTNGTWLWVIQVVPSIEDLALDSYGNCYVIGTLQNSENTFGPTTISLGSGYRYVYVVKMDGQGDIVWIRTYGEGHDPELGKVIAVDNDDNYYIGGIFEDDMGIGGTNLHTGSTNAFFAAKFNSNGYCSWAIQGGSGMNSDDVRKISYDNTGNAFLFYEDGAVSGGQRLIKVSTAGSIMWTISLSGQGYGVRSIATDEFGNCLLTGGFVGTVSFGTISLTSTGGDDIFVAKLDTSGNWIWATKAGGAGGSDNGIGISVDTAGNSFITGEFAATALFGTHTLESNGNTDLFAAKIGASGNWLWAKHSGGSTYDRGNDVDHDANDSFYCIKCFVANSQWSYSIIKGSPPYLRLLSPQGGEVWQTMSMKTVYWYPNTDITLVNIKLSVNNGSSWFYLNVNPVPILEGRYAFSVPAVQSGNCLIRIESATDPNLWYDVSDQTFTISSSNPPSVTLAAPDNENLKLQRGRDYNVLWTANQITNVDLGVSYDAGNSWHSLSQGLPVIPNTYSWYIPDSLYTRCYLRVEDSQVPTIYDWSDHFFTICKLEINSPAENDVWVESTTRIITWDQANLTNVKLEYSTDGGILWQTIVSSINASTGSYSWLVPKLYSTQCKLRISDADDASIFDVSDNLFTIRPQIMLSNLNGGEYLQIYSIYRILWDATAEVSQVTLDYSINGGTTWLTLQGTPYEASLGYYDWFVPNTPSNQALVRVKNVGDTTIYDVSEAVFTITVATIPASLALLSSPSINFGTVFIAESSQYISVVLCNTGGQDLLISSVHFIGEPQHFELQQPLPNLTLVSGETDSLLVRFVPQTVGALSDTLYIVNNSSNEPLLVIRLSGTGEYVPPKPPENVSVVVTDGSATITWDAVTETIYNTPLIPDYYLVFYNGLPYPDGPFYYLGRSWNLAYTHDGVGLHAEHMFYRVRAYKYYGAAVRDLGEVLVPGMPEKEVLQILRSME